jgi:hypothetical protein
MVVAQVVETQEELEGLIEQVIEFMDQVSLEIP